MRLQIKVCQRPSVNWRHQTDAGRNPGEKEVEEEADMKTNQKQAKRKGKLHAALTTHRCAHTHTHACVYMYVCVCVGRVGGWKREEGAL